MNWFGEDWGAPITQDGHQLSTPVGQPCLLCEEAIRAGDRGVFMPYVGKEASGIAPVHAECELRNVLGGIEHLTAPKGHPVGSCYEGSTLTYRQSAVAAWEWLQSHKEVGRG